MYLMQIMTGDLVEVIDLQDVVNPHSPTIRVRINGSERAPRIDDLLKSALAFPSGESLPVCWIDGKFHAHVAA